MYAIKLPNYNPNDISAQVYDFISAPLKGESITNEEISLIGFLAELGSRILDVGGGTGRHAIPLSEAGYKVTVIDSSKEMLRELKMKSTRNPLKIINFDALNCKPKTKNYQLVILMWNTFNEIALTKKDAYKLLLKLKKSLTKTGIILINIDNASVINSAKFNFKTEFFARGLTYELHWKTKKYYKRTNLAISIEKINIFSENGKLLKTTKAEIKQRYWSLDEMEKLARKSGLKISQKKLKGNNELYLLLVR